MVEEAVEDLAAEVESLVAAPEVAAVAVAVAVAPAEAAAATPTVLQPATPSSPPPAKNNSTKPITQTEARTHLTCVAHTAAMTALERRVLYLDGDSATKLASQFCNPPR